MMNRFKRVLEIFGKIVLSRKGQLFLMLALCTAPIASLLFLTVKSNDYQEILLTYQKTALKAKKALHNREKKDQFIEAHLKSDPSYLSDHLESMEFLVQERRTLLELCHHPAIGDRDLLKRRLASIERKQNHLSFNEGEILTSKNCVETLEKLKDPVEISSEDLRNLVAKIEYHQSDFICPQFMIVKFHITRSLNNEEIRNKILELELIKREFIKQ